jgi:hypothetical protein
VSKVSEATADEGMTHRVPTLGLSGFGLGRSPFEGSMKPVRGEHEAHKDSPMTQPMKPKLSMHCKDSEMIEISYLYGSRFSPTTQLVTDLTKDPET